MIILFVGGAGIANYMYAGVPVLPMPLLAAWALLISVALTLTASFFPARRAARLDPCATFPEI